MDERLDLSTGFAQLLQGGNLHRFEPCELQRDLRQAVVTLVDSVVVVVVSCCVLVLHRVT